MTLEQRVQKDMIAAMKAKDKNALTGLRAIKAAIVNAKTDGSGQEIDEAREMMILQKLLKQRQESLNIYEEQNREDLAAIERAEIEVINTFLPEQVSSKEVEEVVDGIISELDASGMKDMGKVMAAANSKLRGRVDGKTLAETVKTKLMA